MFYQENVLIWVCATVATIPVAAYISKMCVARHHHELGKFGPDGPAPPKIDIQYHGKVLIINLNLLISLIINRNFLGEMDD